MTIATLLLLITQAAQPQQIDTLALRAHTRFLSDDALKGRGTGTAGERIAAIYIDSQLRGLGVSPAPGTNSYLQPLPLRRATIDSARLVISGGNGSIALSDDDFLINTGGERALRDFAGPALFVGTSEHAVRAPATALRGQVLVLLGTLGGDAETLIPRWIAAGVSGVILLVPDSAQYALFAASRGEERFFLPGDVNDPIWQSPLPVVIAGPKVTRALVDPIANKLSGFGRSTAFTPVPIGRDVAVTVHATVQNIESRNVLGVIPGSDPKLAGEYVFFTAHYDHLGISTPDARGDSIYNGFSDNAAGVAMLLAIAQNLVHAPPARSVVFLFLSGEERGLLGSTWYAEHPVIPLAKTTAVINLDGGAPPVPPLEWRIAGGTNSPLGALASEIGARHGWQINLGAASANSDYWPFVTHKVPGVFIIPGARWEGVSKQEHDALFARWDHYHQPSDEYAEDFPFRGLQRYAQFAMELGVAAASKKPR